MTEPKQKIKATKAKQERRKEEAGVVSEAGHSTKHLIKLVLVQNIHLISWFIDESTIFDDDMFAAEEFLPPGGDRLSEVSLELGREVDALSFFAF